MRQARNTPPRDLAPVGDEDGPINDAEDPDASVDARDFERGHAPSGLAGPQRRQQRGGVGPSSRTFTRH